MQMTIHEYVRGQLLSTLQFHEMKVKWRHHPYSSYLYVSVYTRIGVKSISEPPKQNTNTLNFASYIRRALGDKNF